MITEGLSMAKQEKIGGFEKYEVRNWLDNLISAQETLNDKKKVAAIKILMAEKAKATDEVEALLSNTGERLKKTFGK